VGIIHLKGNLIRVIPHGGTNLIMVCLSKVPQFVLESVGEEKKPEFLGFVPHPDALSILRENIVSLCHERPLEEEAVIRFKGEGAFCPADELVLAFKMLIAALKGKEIIRLGLGLGECSH
jgi:hypothetical protein